MTDQLLASAMRKLLADDQIYVDIYDGSACIDGWIENLTQE